METITIHIFSREPHLSQILTGFLMLSKRRHCNFKIVVEDHSRDNNCPYRGALLRVFYRGKVIIYDMQDGYQDPDLIRYHLVNCDVYFKRSYSSEKNQELLLPNTDKMYPLGFNYHVSYRNHPIDQPYWKEQLKGMLGYPQNNFCNTGFTPNVFEQKPVFKESNFSVLFCARLWSEDISLTPNLNAERRYINNMRIEILRCLKSMPEIHFVGGLSDNPYTRTVAPDLILPEKLVDRRTYLKMVHNSDICIGSMGLHESIGWKTGEYVAASKAIVNEKLHYQLPGNYQEGTHYLGFDTAEQCVRAVKELINNPHKLYKMKCANYEYYLHFLKPDILVENTLDIADRIAQS